MDKRKRSTVGLNERGRVDWTDPVNLICIRLSEERFHGKVIAKHTGLTTGQVYSRCNAMGFKLRDARDGHGQRATLVLNTYSIKTIKPRAKHELVATIQAPAKKKSKRRTG